MLTIKQALQLPVFSQAQVVAGHGGLERAIKWVHIVDMPNAQFEYQRSGVLLLTVGYGLGNEAEKQATVIAKLAAEGFAGLVLSLGYLLDGVPASIKQQADELDFPIIELPQGILFIEITEAVLGHLINDQYALLQESQEIHKKLTQLVLRGGGLNELIKQLAKILKRGVSMENPSFQVLATAHYSAEDEARRRTVTHGRTTPEVARHLLQAGIYDKVAKAQEPLYVAPIPELEMTLPRLIVPVMVDQQIFAYIWIIVGDQELTELEKLAISHAVTISALIILKEQAVREVEESQRGDFLEMLLRGRAHTAEFAEQARRLKFRPEASHQVFVIDAPPEAGSQNNSLLVDTSSWLETHQVQHLVAWRERHLVAVIEQTEGFSGKVIASRLVESLSHPARQILIGVGRPTQAKEQQAIGRSYEEARESVAIAQKFGQREGVKLFDELGVLHWLYHLKPGTMAGNRYLDYVKQLAAYDEKRRTDLLKTVEVYLDHGGSLVDTAQSLYIHRNTLLHRLERIQSLCNIDLRNPTEKLNLHTAVKSYRLHG